MVWLLVVIVFLILCRPLVVIVPAPEVRVEVNEGSTEVWPPWDPLAISGENRYGFEREDGESSQD